jgi:hypothetical protein
MTDSPREPNFPPSTPLTYPLPDSATEAGWKGLPPRNVKLPPPVPDPPFVPDRTLLAILLAMFASANFAVLPLMEVFRQSDWGAVLVYLSAGMMFAQAGALPFWLVFGSESFLKRTVTFWTAVAALFLCWGAGALIYVNMRKFHYDFSEQARFFALSLPLATVAITLPLWPLKLFLGWSLTRSETSCGDPSTRPLAIRDFLAGTTIVAVSFTLARLAPSRMDGNFWIGWLVFGASVAGVSAISVIPAMLLMLRRSSASLGIFQFYAAGAALITFLISSWLQPYQWSLLNGSRGRWELLGGYLVFFSFAAGLSGAMLAARALGFRLTYASERK